MSGFIYILSNRQFDRIKIGISSKDPNSQRLNELYTTGVPEPFQIEYFAFVENYEIVEKVVHSRLDDKRPNKNREFFTCTVPEAIVVIRNSATIKYEEIFYKSPEEIKKQSENLKKEQELKRKKELEELDRQSKKREETRKKLEEQAQVKTHQKELTIHNLKIAIPVLLVLMICIVGIFYAPFILFWVAVAAVPLLLLLGISKLYEWYFHDR